jgi:hypothetical protein
MDGPFNIDLPKFRPSSTEPEVQLRELYLYLDRLNVNLEEMFLRLYRRIPNP